MAACSYFLEGRCRYGEKCWNEHPRGGRHQATRGGGGSVNRVWVNPSQHSGGGTVQPSSFSRGGGHWGRENSGSGRDERSSNFSFNAQNRFSALSNTPSGRAAGERGGGGGGEDDIDKQLDMIEKDMEVWQSSGQWLFSCYALFKASITGFVELSPEELRMEYYTSRATGDVQSYVNSIQQLVNHWRSRVQELRTMSGHTRTSMIAELSDPRAQTSSGGGGFNSSSSAGFGSTPPAGFGSTPPAGFGSTPPAGFGSTPPAGFGSTPPAGFGSTPSAGFGSTPSAGFGSTPSAGFGSTPSAGFGSTPSAGFGSTPSAGFGSTPSAGFGSTPSAGFGSTPSAGFGSTPSAGFGSTPSAGFTSSSSGFQGGGFGSSAQNSAAGFSFSGSNPGFGSSGSQTAPSQFGSSAPSASSFSFAHPAGAPASKSSATGFGFSSVSAGGFSSSSTAPSGGAFGGGSGASAEDRTSAGELHTPLSELTPDELQEFSAKRFTLGHIPLRAPPAELLHV